MPDISIAGRATDGDADPYGVKLLADGKWQGTEPNNTSKVLSAKSGKWVYKAVPDKGVYASDGNNNVVVFFRNLVPADAKVADSGNGNAYGKGRTIDWTVTSLS